MHGNTKLKFVFWWYFESRTGHRLTCFEDFSRVSQVLHDITAERFFWTKATSVSRFPIMYSAVTHLNDVTLRHADCRKVKQQEIN